MRLYDSFKGKKVPFIPLKEGEVGLYVCGVTVYDLCHLGHGRSFTIFDMMVRYWRALGFEVRYIRNITDVDDKILKKSKEMGCSPEALAEAMTREMHQDFRALGLLEPTYEPRATEHIEAMILLVQRLLDGGFAYQIPSGDLLFRVASFEDYGALSGQQVKGLKRGIRVSSHEKASGEDFVLWKVAGIEEGETSWPSPWGRGRPGWHLECSAMSHQWLGETFDLHGGGLDLKFPHHENERAQSVCGYHAPFARHWVHAGMVTVDDEKMSKSLGNFITLREALQKVSPEVLRVFYLMAHYRSPVRYTPQNLALAHRSLNRWYGALLGWEAQHTPDQLPQEVQKFEEAFHQAMQDDMNTPQAFSVLFSLSSEVYRLRRIKEDEKAHAFAACLKKLAGILGLLVDTPEAFFRGRLSSKQSLEAILAKVEARDHARRRQDWQEADRIRRALEAEGILLEDSPEETHWYLRPSF